MWILLLVVLTVAFAYLFVRDIKQGKKLYAAVDALLIVLNVALIVTSILKG